MTTFFDSKGKIILSAVCSDETKLHLLVDPAYASYEHIDEAVDPERFYIDVVTAQPVPIPEKPGANYYFSYDSYSWVVNQDIAMARAKNIRNGLLASSDWTDTASAPARLGETKYNEWQVYRQALRDVPEQPGFPLNIVWPVPPT